MLLSVLSVMLCCVVFALSHGESGGGGVESNSVRCRWWWDEPLVLIPIPVEVDVRHITDTFFNWDFVFLEL